MHLVGGGPGDPGLITVARAGAASRPRTSWCTTGSSAPELLREARADAELIDVGKGPGHAPYQPDARSTRCWWTGRGCGRTVVRLKGGDPFVFGRGSEEAAACREAGVPVYVVPGVTQRDRRRRRRPGFR